MQHLYFNGLFAPLADGRNLKLWKSPYLIPFPTVMFWKHKLFLLFSCVAERREPRHLAQASCIVNQSNQITWMASSVLHFYVGDRWLKQACGILISIPLNHTKLRVTWVFKKYAHRALTSLPNDTMFCYAEGMNTDLYTPWYSVQRSSSVGVIAAKLACWRSVPLWWFSCAPVATCNAMWEETQILTRAAGISSEQDVRSWGTHQSRKLADPVDKRGLLSAAVSSVNWSISQLVMLERGSEGVKNDSNNVYD